MSQPQMSLLHRLWIYQSERFPLAKTVPLLAVFSAASVNVSALLAGRDLPEFQAYLTAFVLVFVIFFQMRAADEWKDREIDALYRPERPVPRGLVPLRLIIDIAMALSPTAVLFAYLSGWGVVGLLVLVWVWLALMTAEFGVPRWLTARPLLYLVSHMAIMPLIDLLLTGVEWVGHGAAPALILFLILSFLNGCVLEIGRKVWAPEAERDGVETYSRLWGARRAASVWLALVVAAAGVLVLLGVALGVAWPMAAVAALGAVACGWVALRMRAAPTPRHQGWVDAAAGLWVLICYAAAGFLPLAMGA